MSRVRVENACVQWGSNSIATTTTCFLLHILHFLGSFDMHSSKIFGADGGISGNSRADCQLMSMPSNSKQVILTFLSFLTQGKRLRGDCGSRLQKQVNLVSVLVFLV
jgi:hypothetical protein